MLSNQLVNVDKVGYFDFAVDDDRLLSVELFEGECFYHNLGTIHEIQVKFKNF